MTYRRAGGAAGLAVVPDLAISLPTPTDDGRTYVFQLRDGIRFSDGGLLTPEDVVATFERILTTRSNYGRVLFQADQVELVGASACTWREPAACDLSRGVVADAAAGTVTFHLAEPQPNLLLLLATTAFAILPSGTPRDLQGEPAPGTGPYIVTEVGNDGSAVLERNPESESGRSMPSRRGSPTGSRSSPAWPRPIR